MLKSPNLPGKNFHLNEVARNREGQGYTDSKSSAGMNKGVRMKKKRRSRLRRKRHNSSSESSSSDDEYQIAKQSGADDIIGAVARENMEIHFVTDLDNEHKGPRCSAQSDVSIQNNVTPCVNPWEEFSDYVRSIDVDTMSFQQKCFNDKSSSDFKHVMDEIEALEKLYSKKHSVGLKRALNKIRKPRQSKTNDADSDNTDGNIKKNPQAEEEFATAVQIKLVSKRGWNMVKAKVEDDHLARRKSQAPVGWTLLSKAVTHLTDQERARQVLYERYIHKPNSWAEGLSADNYPDFLKEKEQKVNGRMHRPMTTGSQFRMETHQKDLCVGAKDSDSGHRDKSRTKINRPKSSFVH